MMEETQIDREVVEESTEVILPHSLMEIEARRQATKAMIQPMEGLRSIKESLRTSLKGIDQLRSDRLTIPMGKMVFVIIVAEWDTGVVSVHS